MKILNKIFFFCFVAFIYSCDTNEKFSGSPVGNQEIITLDAVVSTDVDYVAGNQDIEYGIVLPKTFKDTAIVEVSIYTSTGGRTKATVEILPGQVSPSETPKIKSPVTSLFNTELYLTATAISLKNEEIGKHYLIKSNKEYFDSGSVTVPEPDVNKLKIKFVWPDILPSQNINNLVLIIDRPASIPDAIIPNFTNEAKNHSINISNTGTHSVSNSYAEGDYVLRVKPIVMAFSPFDMPYNVVLVYPDGKTEIYKGIFSGLTLNTETAPFLQINKSTNVDGDVVFTPTKL